MPHNHCKRSIFIIDDEIEIREQIAESISRISINHFSIDVQIFSDPKSALLGIQFAKPDVIILDQNLPNMSGLEFSRILNEKKIEVPIIFITGDSDPTLFAKTHWANAYDYIEKPIDLKKLKSIVKHLLLEDPKNLLNHFFKKIKPEKQIQITLPENIYQKMEKQSIESGLSISTIISNCLELKIIENETDEFKNEQKNKTDNTISHFIEKALDGLNNAIYIKDQNNNFIFTNQKFDQLFNLNKKNHYLKNNIQIQSELKTHPLKEIFNEFASQGKSSQKNQSKILHQVDKDYIYQITENSFSTREEKHYIIGTIHDVTKLKEQDQLLNSVKKYLENSDFIFGQFDLDFCPIYFNKTGHQHLKNLENEKSILEYYNKSSIESFKKEIDRIIFSKKPWSGNVTLNLSQNNEEVFFQKIYPIINVENKVESFITFIEQLSDIKKVELKLIDSARLASLGEMASGIAHEINNPLSIIVGYSLNLIETLLETKIENLDITNIIEKLKKIETTSHRISKIVKGLRAMSKDQSHEPPKEILGKLLIDETLELCKSNLIKQNVNLNLEIDPNLILLCRSNQISQVLFNFISNSIDALDDFSKKNLEKTITIKLYKKNNRSMLSVLDNGPGIPLEIRAKIMDPFFTTKDPRKGTGLGLSISRSIIESHGGSIKLDDTYTQGAKFDIELPLPLGHSLEIPKKIA